MKPLLLFSAVFCAFLFARDATAQITDNTTSTVAIRAQGSAMEVHTLNRNFLFDSRLHYGADAPTRLLMRLDVETIQRDDTEGLMQAAVTARVWRLDSADKRVWLWSTMEPGDMGEIEQNQPLFIVRQPGCCGARDSFSAFALDTGRRLFTATGDRASQCWATLEVPNSGGIFRYVALHAAFSSTDDVAFAGRKETVGLLTYAAPDKPLARYRLAAKDAAAVDSFMGEGLVRLVDDTKAEETDNLTLWSADKKTDPAAIGGFSIHVDLTPDSTVVIPVKADKLDLANAKLPPGLSIEPADLP
jgi:hypothetical protein